MAAKMKQPCSPAEAFDVFVRRQIAGRNRIIELNRSQWAAIRTQEEAVPRWFRWAWQYRGPIPIAIPPPLDRDVHLRGIELGLI